MNDMDELKYVIYDEWTYDPPGGYATYYYDAWGDDETELSYPIDEILEHVAFAAEDEDISEISPYHEDGSITLEDIKSWSWDNGGVGCGTVVYAEGNDIASAAADFYRDYLEDFAVDYFAENDEDFEDDTPNRADIIIEKATDNPGDYDVVIELLELISALIEAHKEAMY